MSSNTKVVPATSATKARRGLPREISDNVHTVANPTGVLARVQAQVLARILALMLVYLLHF